MGYQPQQQPEEQYDPNTQPDSPAGSSSLIGRTLAHRYRFNELLGEGTFARVYRVYDTHRRVNLAAKVLRSDIAQEPAFLERFQREAKVLARLQHPHIVRYYDTLEVEDQVFILTDYIAGQTLQNRLRQINGPISPVDSLVYLEPLAAGLHYAHQEGIVHRDLKPANILLDDNGNLYITDFGIARILSDTSTLTLDTTVGTPHYMSPEQILIGEVTAATDIYALGVILYQMYTGRLPFMGDSATASGGTTAMRIVYEHLHVPPVSLRDLNPELSKPVEDVVLRCLEKDPSQRFASVSDLYDALTVAVGTPSVSLDAAVPLAPQAEPVPTGVGGLSQVLADDAAWDQKPKRKPKRQETGPERRPSEKEQEKDQASEEKNQEKEQEKGWETNIEKSEFWNEVSPSDRLGQFTLGGMIVWAGTILLLTNLDATHAIFSDPLAWMASGAGALILAEVAVRMTLPEYRSRPGLRLVLGVGLLLFGLVGGISFDTLWPLILIGIGISIVINHLTG